MKLKILYLSANPILNLRTDTEYNRLKKIVKSSDYRDYIKLDGEVSTTIDDLISKLNKFKPHILHFSGHGEKNGEIFFSDDSGKISNPINGELFKKILDTTNKPKLIFLNACYSLEIANNIKNSIDFIIGMNNEINDDIASKFAERFYISFLENKTISTSFNQAQLLKDGYDIPKLLGDDKNDFKLSNIIPISDIVDKKEKVEKDNNIKTYIKNIDNKGGTINFN